MTVRLIIFCPYIGNITLLTWLTKQIRKTIFYETVSFYFLLYFIRLQKLVHQITMSIAMVIMSNTNKLDPIKGKFMILTSVYAINQKVLRKKD